MIRKKRKLVLILFLIIIQSILSGCWDNRDITEKAYVAAIGLDKGQEDKMFFTVQIVKPAALKAIQEGAPFEEAIWTFTSEGKTLIEAARNLLTTINRRPFYTHLQLIVIGEDIAKEGIGGILDVLERDYEMRLTPDVIIAKNTTGKTILECISELEPIPAMHIAGVLESNSALGKSRQISLFDTINELRAAGSNTVIGTIELREGVTPSSAREIKDKKVEGSAVFKHGKLVGMLTPEENKGFVLVMNELEGTIINVPNPVDENEFVAIELRSSTAKKDVNLTNGSIALDISVDCSGNLGEQHGEGDLTTYENLSKLESSVEENLKEVIRHAVDASQKKFGADIFGFGKEVGVKYPEYWNSVSDNWNEVYEKLQINIYVNFKIKRTGLIAN